MNQKAHRQLVRRNFLEQLRELGREVGDSVKKDVVKGVAETGLQQILGGEGAKGEIFTAPAVPETKPKFTRQEYLDVVRQERILIKRAEQDVRLEMEGIRKEIMNLIRGIGGLSREVEIAAMQAPVEPGAYHLNFLERLRETIIFLTKSIKESFNWLAVCNQRAKKRCNYWSQVQKSGTKFMLSQERYMATQAG